MPFDGRAQPDCSADGITLLAVQHLIDSPSCWVQCAYRGDWQRCTVQAIRDICVVKNDRGRHVQRLAALLVNEIPGKKLPSFIFPCTRLISFNDHKRTKHADIMALFDRAIARTATTVIV